MRTFSPFSPVDIQFASKAEAVELLSEWSMSVKNVLIIASESLLRTFGLVEWGTHLVKEHGVQCIRTVPANPSVEDVFTQLHQLGDTSISRIIALGGGSCIDLAKAISALHGRVSLQEITIEWVRKSIKDKGYLRDTDFIDIFAVPTTAGTGSEVTKWATIWDSDNEEKLSIDCVGLFPKCALIVPEFTAFMPPRVTLSTGLDALSHAMEAFWAKSRTPLSQALAICAIQHIYKNLPIALSDGTNLPAREGMCLASLISGLSFSITRTTACHSISYPLTMMFGIEHGLAAVLSIVPIARRNHSTIPEISQIYDVFGGEKSFESWLDAVCGSIVQLRLSAFGVTANDLSAITEKTFTQGRMDNNPVSFNNQDILEILTEIL